MVNDTLSDMLTRIRNGCMIKSDTVSIPLTKMSEKVSYILEKEGFIKGCQKSSIEEIVLLLKYRDPNRKPCITNLKRISKPGLRIYANHKEIPRILGGMGIVILSTSQGIITDREARFRKIGGELLCSIW